MISVEEYRTERLQNVLNFLLEQYDNEEALGVLCNFDYEDIHWSSTCSFAKFRYDGYDNWKNNKTYPRGNRDKPVRIQLNSCKWLTYQMKSIGLYADTSCSESQDIELQLVHELTHMIQKSEGRKLSEVETTKNEIEYVKQHHPFLYDQLLPIE